MSQYSSDETASQTSTESEVEQKVEVKETKKVIKKKAEPKEAWKPDEEPESKPKRKYVRKAQTEEEALAIKQKKIDNLAKAREIKKLKQQSKNSVEKPKDKGVPPPSDGGVKGGVTPSVKAEKPKKTKVVKQYITNNYISEKTDEKEVPVKAEKPKKTITIQVPKFNFV